MGKKKLQGADGMNFQLQLTIKGLESINLPEENLTNESGNDIMKISCWGGKLSAYVNLPNAIRPNNVQPFQLSDCIKIELVRNQVIEHMRSYLQKHLKDKYSDEFLSMMSVTKMECNLTIKCVGDCKPKDDVIPLLKQYHFEYIQTRFSHGTAWQGDLSNGGNLFIQSDGKLMGHTTPYQYFTKLLHRYNEWVQNNPDKAKAEGLEELPIIPLHGLRHSCATLLNYLEVNIIEISKTLGHSTCSTTMNIYAHSFEEQQEEVATKVNEFLRLNA